ncbi:acetyltransferase [Merismopedia glauca]|uniref:Acetyltransferase n=1 Tax=Merismopedia glauca CCAP 1448/3 TaxID=1296344 RepID=A0A2T1C6T2_9CYAN|nr:acetyltransferase [Merismopedia glauca]PSB03847.1 acetyltransferase [Merismopedia glauca CCAP 1448/3]
MFLINQQDGSLVEVLNLQTLLNPSETEVIGRFHAGEELQDEEKFPKSELIFPSGESLPRCWVDSHYREHQ